MGTATAPIFIAAKNVTMNCGDSGRAIPILSPFFTENFFLSVSAMESAIESRL